MYQFLTVRNDRDVPVYAVMFSAAGVLLLGVLSFSDVINILNLLYCFGQLIEFAAFVWLRYKRPDLHRPYEIPLGLAAVTVMLLFPTVFIFVIIGFSTRLCFWTAVCLGVSGAGAYYVMRVCKRRRWIQFVDVFDIS